MYEARTSEYQKNELITAQVQKVSSILAMLKYTRDKLGKDRLKEILLSSYVPF